MAPDEPSLRSERRDAPSASCRVDYRRLETLAAELAAEFWLAKPFPHVVIDDLAHLSSDDLSQFPGPEWPGWVRSAERYQGGKMTCNDPDLIPLPFLNLIDELSRPQFISKVEVITGIPKLIPDPYLVGAGLHMSAPGGALTAHTDFHYHPSLDLYRRINLLLYLNPDWSEADGGCLELGDHKNGGHVTVVPLLGRCVIFATTDVSVHGFPQPIVSDRYRKSIALYYYTAQDSSDFGGLLTTDWREHGHGSLAYRTRVAMYKSLLQSARGLTVAAHFVNPNQGPRVVRQVVHERLKRRRSNTN
jgi:Rps23 Pro-64 3,4-dihydroxylase Tpa1-like proline 4-hydroxylase